MDQRYYRRDLSEWLIHFVHDRKTNDDLYAMAELAELESGSKMQIPCFFDKEGNPRDLTNEFYDKEFYIEDDAPAFSVLRKIVHDGFIRSGWSFCNNSPTVYGPYSTVCFTEMPLHALIQYAANRGTWCGYVGNYGIAFKRKELYTAGARPVIYGLSTDHIEATDESDKNFGKGLRCLSCSTGLGLEEQYRYVYTKLDSSNPTDWMHEREWRWPLNKTDEFSLPGMPFLLSGDYDLGFSEVLIIVDSDEEQEEIRLQLKNEYDSRARQCGIEYKLSLIPAVKILSLQTLRNNKVDFTSVKIEDIPYLQVRVGVCIPVSEALRKKVQEVLKKAEGISNDAQKEYVRAHPDYQTPPFNWGDAYVSTSDISEVTQALLDLGLASTFADGVYMMHVGNYCGPDMDLYAVGAEAAAKYMESELGQSFYVKRIPN